jgi:FkbM family methyltransferase
MKYLVKSVIRNLQNLISRSTVISRAYLNITGAVAKYLPDGAGKSILANVKGIEWPDIDFPAKRVWVSHTTRLNLFPHAGEFDFAALYLRQLSYEPEVFNFLEEKALNYDAIIEVGSNVGVFTCFFSHILKRNKKQVPIFAFEPSLKVFRRLLQNLAANEADNVHAFNCALSDETGFMQFFEPEGHLTNGSLSREFAGIFSSQVKSNPVVTLSGALLDSLLISHDRILFKIDVEGAEAEVLSSLREIITSKRPDILLEVLGVDEAKLNNLDFITEGYQLFNITMEGLIEKRSFEADDHFRDYLLLPIQK